MSDKRRRWFQIHLSTVILMVESAVLLGLNAVPQGQGLRGWPETFVWWKQSASWPHSFSERRFVIDAATAFVILAMSYKLNEWRIHRREALNETK
jgi:hypothetical protein